MDKTIPAVLGGIGMLIAVYLILSNPTGDSAAANALGSNGVSTIKALQGR